ncbi:HNH endonuclease family protein [Streptomyces coacervatus]|uniref:HNH endonuclease family protein n=1 Tax=Streptomyces coacervatus TaxID=647381 RepID=UPI0023DC9AC3|nr:HNH endonuclease family protein [Streptomyces coacervatus]MDF2269332.1 HNH endonuclease family protein [Streptomyces coacervatus]
MIKHLSRSTAALSLAVVALAGPASASPSGLSRPVASLEMPEPPAAAVAIDELQTLTVEAPHPMTGYSRAKFPHWATQFGKCDTREVVLARDGVNVKQDEECRAVSGTWRSQYDNKTVTTASQIDIDHMVPLANGWRSGADTWTTAKRKQFANDLEHSQLIAVSAASNRSKGDQSPDQWAPPNSAYWCTYSRAWTHVKSLYGLSVTAREKSALQNMLGTCP